MNMDPQVIKEETQYIIHDLLQSRNKDDIIREVCWRTKCTWAEGEYLVERVQRENKKTIQQEKSPMRMFISISAVAVGLFWLGTIAFQVIPLLITYSQKNGGLQGFTYPGDTFRLVLELVSSLVLILYGAILTSQQLKTIRG